MTKIVIIDGKSVFYRGYYAMGNLGLKDGTPTGGVYGFASILLTALAQLKPTHVMVAWDKKGTSTAKRTVLYADYKANRKPAPDDFYAQVPLLHQFLQAFNIPLFEIDGYEADDIMATLATQASKQQLETILITGDLDLLQAINPFTQVFITKTGFSKIEQFNQAHFEAKYQIKLTQFSDYKALKGDSSDNIPGVSGIGPKAAAELLQQYQNLSDIYDHLTDIKPSWQKKLTANRDMAFLSLQLVKLLVDAPITLDLNLGRIDQVNMKQVANILDKFEFKSLKSRLNKISVLPQIIDDQPNLFTTFTDKVIKTSKINSLNDFINQIVFAEMIDDKLYLSKNNEDIIYELTEIAQNLTDLKKLKLIISSDIKKLLHQLSNNQNWQTLTDLPFGAHQIYDINQAGFLLDSLNPIQFSDVKLQDFSDLKQTYLSQQEFFQQNPRVLKVATDLDFPLSLVLFLMEQRGVKIDLAFFDDFNRRLRAEIATLTTEIYKLATIEFNINSPKQLSEVLFDKLNLPTTNLRKTSYGYSTGRQTLDLLEAKHPIITKIKQVRELTKLQNTYVEALPKLVDDGHRLHSTFAQNVTSTGRLSSANPNLQNIPIKSTWGKQLRNGFVADDNKVLISLDYSQFELRLAAELADDQAMLKVFNQNRDIHQEMAAELFKIPLNRVSKKQRRIAKTVNFGVLYGMSARSLALGIDGLEYPEAKQLIEQYFATRSQVRQFMDNTLKQAKEKGFVETYYGRRRLTPDVNSPNFQIREAAKRASANMPIQGSGSDLMKKAMFQIEQYLNSLNGAKQILQIHDSILIEADLSLTDEISQKVRQIMVKIEPKLRVKLKVDVKIGKTWFDL